MNNDLQKFSEERLQGFVDRISVGNLRDSPTLSEMIALSRIALAAKQAKPVGYLFVSPDGGIAYSISNVEFEGVKLVGPIYSTPQPAHAEQHMVVPDGFTEIQLIKAMIWINRVRAENPNMKEARTCAELILRLLPAAPKPE